MENAADIFHTNMLRVRTLGGLYGALSNLITGAVDPSDILRAQIVLVVSALDHYVHQISFLGIQQVLDGLRPSTRSFLSLKVSMESVMGSWASPGTSDRLLDEIRERHSYLSFQKPESIAEAVRLFSDVSFWSEVGKKLSQPEVDVKNRLTLIVDRRNKIAHEADMDPSYPGARWPISESDVEATLEFVEDLCEAIDFVVRGQDVSHFKVQ